MMHYVLAAKKGVGMMCAMPREGVRNNHGDTNEFSSAGTRRTVSTQTSQV